MRTILAGAVDLARSALLELEPTGVGAHLGVRAEDACAATHCFEATLPGYHGWQWAVVVAAAPDTDRVTVSESALLPGPDALIAPEFVPWEQRIRPGDLAPGDLLAPPADDPRLVPGYTATGDPEIDEVAYQVGLGRKQVLSREGRDEAAQRWYEEYGPDSEMARAAPATCESCGFYVPLAGALRASFGVCANAMGADGHVVHMGYGCGAHSDTPIPTGAGSPAYEAYDDAAVEVYPAEALRARPGETGSDQGTGDTPAVEPVASGVQGPSGERAVEDGPARTGTAGTEAPVVETAVSAQASEQAPAEAARPADPTASVASEPEAGSGTLPAAEPRATADPGAAETETAAAEEGTAQQPTGPESPGPAAEGD